MQLYHLYGKVKVAVAPLLSGAGVKGKASLGKSSSCLLLLRPLRRHEHFRRTSLPLQVNQAMKFGVPVVATPVAVEGMHGQDGVDCMVANNPEDFAKKIVQLHSDCDLWQRLVAGGRKNMIDHFSVETARPIMLEVRSLEAYHAGLSCSR